MVFIKVRVGLRIPCTFENPTLFAHSTKVQSDLPRSGGIVSSADYNGANTKYFVIK